MAYQDTGDSIVIDGWKEGIASSPYLGISNIRNLNCSYYPGVAYTNYRRQQATTGPSTTSISLDTSANLGSSSTGSISASYTTSGTNRILFVQTSDVTGVASNVTYNSTPLTRITDIISTSLVGTVGQTLWYLNNPTVGAHTLTVTGALTAQSIARDANSGGSSSGANSTTVSHTCTGTQLALLVGVNCADGDNVTGVTYGGVAMTQLVKEVQNGGGQEIYIYGILNPKVGANNIVATRSTASGSLSLCGSSYTGVSQFSIPDASGVNNSASTASLTTSVTTVASNTWTFLVAGNNASATINAGTGSNRVTPDTTGLIDGFDSNGALASPGSHSMTVTQTLRGIWAAMVSLAPFQPRLMANAISYTGVSQDAIPNYYSTNNTTSLSSELLSVNTRFANSWTLLAVSANPPPASVTYAGGTTARQDNKQTTNEIILADSNGPVISPSTTSLRVNFSGTVANPTGIMVFFEPIGASTSNPVAKAQSPLGLNYILDTNGNIFKQSAVNSTTFNLLSGGSGRVTNGSGGLAFWNNYLVVLGNGDIEFCGNGTGDAGIISSNWNVVNINQQILGSPSPSEILRSAGNFIGFYVNDPVQFTTTGVLPSPLAINTTYYVTSVATNIMQVSLSPGGSNITITTVGTGINIIVSFVPSSFLLPLGNITNLTFSSDLNIGDTSAVITGYNDPTGKPVGAIWRGATGQYNIISSSGDMILSVFTSGSSTVNFLSPIVNTETGTFSAQLLSTTTINYKAYVSKVDGNLYFANGRNLGRIISENANTVFNPGIVSTYSVDFAATEILQQSDVISDMVDLQSTLIISGIKDLYTWDYVSSNVTAPTPVGENISSIVNLLNNIYVFAGQKGNIYISNGFSSQIFTKIPDFIASTIDPVWSWGGIMVHRSKLFFQALAQTTSGTNILAGIFSLIASPAAIGEVASGLVMESQNSYGLTPASGALSNGLLIDNSPSSTGFDSYYSAWSNGASTGGIDYNDTTLWQNFEPVIETDIIPIGKILDKKTFGNIEFKLDRPMVIGDQIKLFWRPSLSDNYVQIGNTFTNAQLSDYATSNISQAQWAQFKITFKCASSGSSFIPLRELTLYYD